MWSCKQHNVIEFYQTTASILEEIGLSHPDFAPILWCLFCIIYPLIWFVLFFCICELKTKLTMQQQNINEETVINRPKKKWLDYSISDVNINPLHQIITIIWLLPVFCCHVNRLRVLFKDALWYAGVQDLWPWCHQSYIYSIECHVFSNFNQTR